MLWLWKSNFREPVRLNSATLYALLCFTVLGILGMVEFLQRWMWRHKAESLSFYFSPLRGRT